MDWINNFDSSSLDELFLGPGQNGTLNCQITQRSLIAEEGLVTSLDRVTDSVRFSIGQQFENDFVPKTSSDTAIFDDSYNSFDSQKTQFRTFNEVLSDDDQFYMCKDNYLASDSDLEQINNHEEDNFEERTRKRGRKKGKNCSKLNSIGNKRDIQYSNESDSTKSLKYSRFHDNPRNRCMSKNAIIARENRSKKKKYVESLKASVMHLASENDVLKRRSQEKADSIESLANEVAYLKGVLANSSVLSKLLQNIPNCLTRSVSDAPVIASSDLNDSKLSEHHRVMTDHNYAAVACPQTTRNGEDVGVCLHVADKRVTLEFCAKCNDSAQLNSAICPRTSRK